MSDAFLSEVERPPYASGESEGVRRWAAAEPRLRRTFVIVLLLIGVLGSFETVLDDLDPLSFHAFIQVSFVLLCLTSVSFLCKGWMTDLRGLQRAEERVRISRHEAAHWKSRAEKLLAGLGVEIDRQFDRWSLTTAEREVALLVLKGLGHKDAARVLDRSERTVRHHAASVYRKSGLAGRAELAAFFLEDLLLPKLRE